jgi:hypothetical protein
MTISDNFVIRIPSSHLIDDRYTHLNADEKRQAAHRRVINMIHAMQVPASVGLERVTHAAGGGEPTISDVSEELRS